MKKIFIAFFVLLTFQFQAQLKVPLITPTNPLEQEANVKIGELQKLIEKAKKKKIDVTKELTSIYIAKTFLKYASWDEKNVELNTELFKYVRIHRKNAEEVAEKLPRVERKDVIKLLDHSTEEITQILLGKKKRQNTTKIDWSLAKVDKDRIVADGQTVFLSDFMYKPDDQELNAIFGDKDTFEFSALNLEKEGLVEQQLINQLSDRKEETLGTVCLDQTKIPFWANQLEGANQNKQTSIFSSYDIDNPITRDIYKNVLLEVIPYTTGKKFADLGYRLSNNPYLETIKDNSLLQSKYAVEKFKNYLKVKHKNIETLNLIWKTTFSSFDEISNISESLFADKTSPSYYDWTIFKMDRNTEWLKFLKYRIKKDNPLAKVHTSLTPNTWIKEDRSHGVDFEAVTNLSGIVGTTTGADHIRIFGKPLRWEKRYKFDWIEACMSYDFMKSISPDKFIYNSESHFLSNKKSRDLYLDPLFSRSILWLAHLHGMSVSNNWFWNRGLEGEVNPNLYPEEYACTNGQQALVTNEFAMTMIDINANADDILSIQREKKPIRLFYSKTSAINKTNHMDAIFKLYEQVSFNGIPVGFVTQNILESQNSSNWEVVLIKETEYVTSSEFDALQKYLNKGGIVVVDDISLKYDEYKRPLNKILNAGKGKIIKAKTLEDYENKGLAVMDLRNITPNVSVKEINENGKRGCLWNVTTNKEGESILSIVNVGNTVADLEIKYNRKEAVCTDIINGVEIGDTFVLGLYEVLFVKVNSK